MSTEPEVTTDETTTGPAELRAALARKDERIAQLEGKLSVTAFEKAGFPGGEAGSKAAKERAALEKFYQGDRTDADAIRKFAEEELGYSPGAGAKKQEVTHVQPAPSVVADARIDEMDAGAEDAAVEGSDEELVKLREAHLKAAQDPNQDNRSHIESAIAAELARMGEL